MCLGIENQRLEHLTLSLLVGITSFYLFPSFSLVGRKLAKVNKNKTDAVIVVPDWSTQY